MNQSAVEVSRPWDRPFWKPVRGKEGVFAYLVLIHVLAIVGLILFPLPGWKIFGGYQANRNVAVELSYLDLGASNLSASGTVGAVPVTLSWQVSSGATSYHAQVSTSSTFTPLVYDQSGITTTSTTVSGLARRTTYFWRVFAADATEGPASAVRSFRTAKR